MKRLIVFFTIACSIWFFAGCQKTKKTGAPKATEKISGPIEVKKIKFVPPLDSSVTSVQAKSLNHCNALLDSLSIFYQDSFKTKDAVHLTRFQEDFSKAQDKLCLKSGLAGGYPEYLWILKNLGNPRNAKLLDSLKMIAY